MTDGTLGESPGAARAAGTAVDDPGSGPAGAAAGNSSAITANLPAVGGPDDPYVDRPTRAARGSVSAPTVGGSSLPVMPPPAPTHRPNVASAVDQYAALGVSDGAASAAATVVGAGPLAPAPPLPSATTPGLAAPGAPPTAAATPPVAPTVRRPRNERTPRRARLQLRHFNVWTVFKFSVVLAVALFFVWMIIIAVLYGALDHLKVIDKINKTVQTIENNSDTKDAVTPRIVFTTAFLIGLVNIVLFIVLTTIGSVVYNLCADLVGGIEVTLAERD